MFGSSAVSKRKDRKDHHLFALSREDKKEKRAAERQRERDREEPRHQDVRDSHTGSTRMVAGAVGAGLLLIGVRYRHSVVGRFAIGIGVAALEMAVTGYFPSVVRTVGLARAA